MNHLLGLLLFHSQQNMSEKIDLKRTTVLLRSYQDYFSTNPFSYIGHLTFFIPEIKGDYCFPIG